MDLARVLQQLHEELENLNAAIVSLERLQESGKNRSKGEEWLAEVPAPEGAGKSRKARPRSKADSDLADSESGESK
jgi:hypothetical protein